ncbi:ribosome recycling factor [Candidatus Nomurabacteria bacterium]|nr:ribosome recycling factor [Candidatus Nomurabacteria bacterium]
MHNFNEFQQHLDEAVEWLRKEYAQISAGRAHPALLDKIRVENYGSEQPIQNMASINLEDVRTLRIVPWDKSLIQPIEKAIRTSEVPLGVSVDGEGVRASVPQVTEENKKQLVKVIKDKLEDARITVRNHRNTTNKEIDGSDMSDDEKRDAEEKMQKLVEEINKKLEEVFKKKEQDIMTV